MVYMYTSHEIRASPDLTAALEQVCIHCCSVGASHQLKMSVSKVSQKQYDRLHSDLSELHKAGQWKTNSMYII